LTSILVKVSAGKGGERNLSLSWKWGETLLRGGGVPQFQKRGSAMSFLVCEVVSLQTKKGRKNLKLKIKEEKICQGRKEP